MSVRTDKDKFIEYYNRAGGDFYEFTDLLQNDAEETLPIATFYRRRAKWISGLCTDADTKPDTTEDTTVIEDPRPVAGGTVHSPDKRRRALRGKRFVFTSAQNNTFVHAEFLNNLLTFCEDRGAQLVVGKFRYNKSGFQNATKDKDQDLWYDPKILPYIIDESCDVEESNAGLVWCGELDILPTAANPLSGLDSYSHSASSIIPHAKVQLHSVPVMKGSPTKMLYTTGAVTQRNYIQRKAGQKAEFHHVFGATYVEIDEDGDHFVRQLIADSSGGFYDLTDLYHDGYIYRNEDVEAINWGDIHAEMVDPRVALKGWEEKGCMLDVLKPSYQFIHDLTDFKARNHHNRANPHFLAEMHFSDQDCVADGMYSCYSILRDLEREYCTSVVVESNHDQAFRRWLSEADVRSDPVNAEYFHKSNMEVYKNIRLGTPDFNVFEWAVRSFGHLENTTFLQEDDSFLIGGGNGIECGMHGHRGPNGSRGNPKSLRALGRKVNIGHTHSACIIDGVYVAGISCSMDMGYNKGPSSWSHSHIITYKNGKRTIITMKNGKWRA